MRKTIKNIGISLLRLFLDPAAWLLSRFLPVYVRESFRVRYFPVWEKRGIHLSPVHFYEPIPDTRLLTDRLLERESDLRGVDMRESDQLDLLRNVFPRFRAEYAGLARKKPATPNEFYLNNGYFTGADALVYYAMVRHFQPRHLIEVGCGFSSLLAAQACRLNGKGDLVCVDPFPGQTVKGGFPELKRLIPKPVQEVDPELFQQLNANDILFIDSSHVVKCCSDVNWLVLEILPRLKPGVLVHFHDIFLPQEYSKAWVMERYRFFSEQYLLQAFLIFNTEFQVVFANHYMALKHREEMAALFSNVSGFGSTSFWIRREGSE
jgi:Methyltransferase domain